MWTNPFQSLSSRRPESEIIDGVIFPFIAFLVFLHSETRTVDGWKMAE